MQDLAVPERAIQAFEKIHGLQVTIHDLRGSLAAGISRDRFQHRHPLCKCVKAGGGEWHCVTFEVLKLRADLHAHRDGRCHVCHAGLVEWMTPIYDRLELEWVLFAGVRLPGADLGPLHREPLTRWTRPPWDARTPLPPTVDRAEADLILEHLLQLGARLQAWARQAKPLPTSPPAAPTTPLNSLLLRRRTLIRRYIESQHSRPLRLRDLAAQLNVSEDRATHLVRECCGQTFREMLIDSRLRSARELLRLSSLPVLEVALASGFSEISHFNRLFRLRVGCAPNEYRKQAFREAMAE